MKHSNIVMALIEDDREVREGLKSFFESQPEFDTIYAFESVEDFFEHPAASRTVNIVLTDIGLPGKSGIEGIRLIRERKQDADVVMITVFRDAEKIFQSLCAGATGYILKGSSFTEIRECVFTILGGGSYMSPAIARRVVEYFSPPRRNSSPALTQREEQIVRGLVDGLSYKLIAARLEISIDTVRYHIKNIYAKLEVNSKTEVISRYLRERGK